MRIMTMRNWERPVRIAAILILVLTLLSPLGSLVFADDGTTTDPPVTEETDPPEDGEEQDAGETPPAEDGGDTAEDETCPVTEEAAPADESASDPYFTVGDETYNFSSDPTYCDGDPGEGTTCFDGLTTPIQDSVDHLSDIPATPDDNTIYVEAGTYAEDVVIDGTAWNTGAETPDTLILESVSGSGSTIIDGNVLIQFMRNFELRGLTVTGGVVAQNNTGSLTIEDVVASNTDGTGITVDNQDGEVTLNDVNASGNTDGDGAYISADGVTVTNSTFNENTNNNYTTEIVGEEGNGLLIVTSGGPIVLSNVTANGNEESGAVLIYNTGPDETNEIRVSNSQFKNNGEFGVFTDSAGGTVTYKCVATGGNAFGGTAAPVGETVIWIKCEEKCKDDKDQYKDTVLKPDKEKYVNVGHGMMIKFPAIEPEVEGDKSYGRFRPLLKSDELPADLLPGDFFMVGVDIIIVNAVIPEGESLIVEFFIAGYQWEENFAVLWFDAGATEWVDVPFTKVPHERIPGGKLVAEWDQAGIFILVLREEVTPDA